MVTYGDLMTLLLCFFVLLFSFSSLESKKFESLKESLTGAFGFLSGTSTTLGKGAKKKPKKKTDSTFEKAVSRVLVKMKRKTNPKDRLDMLERAVLQATKAVRLVSQQRERVRQIVHELEEPTSRVDKKPTNFTEVVQETLESKEPRNFPTERQEFSDATEQNKEEPESANQPLDPPRSKGDSQEHMRSDLTEIDIAQGRDQTMLENTGNQRKKDQLSGRARLMEKFHDIEKYRSEDQQHDFRQKPDIKATIQEYTTLSGMVEKTSQGLSHAVFNLSEELLFKKNEIELKEDSKEKLYRIFLQHYNQNANSVFQIESHTDFAQPPSFKYPTSWHLAAARALRVLEFLFEESEEFDPARFCIVSFGAYQPKFQYSPKQLELEENRRLEVRMFQKPGGSQYGR
jgi:flagellar motor protein MotB